MQKLQTHSYEMALRFDKREVEILSSLFFPKNLRKNRNGEDYSLLHSKEESPFQLHAFPSVF